MSSLISSFIVDPFVRQARRFSGAALRSAEERIEFACDSSASSENVSTISPPPPPPSSSPPPLLSAFLENAVDDDDNNNNNNNNNNEIDNDNDNVPQTAGAQQINPSLPYSPFIRHHDSAVVEHDERSSVHELDTISTAGPPATDLLNMSSNPSHNTESQLRQLTLDEPRPSTSVTLATRSTVIAQQAPSSAHAVPAGENAPTISESLPADDGMRHLRARIHQIRDLSVLEEEKAQMMHSLMTERYNCLRPTSPSSFVSNDRPFTPTSGKSIFSEVHVSSPISTASEVDPENAFNLRPGDTNPTHRIRSLHHSSDNTGEDEDFDTAEDGSSLGCQHYKRNVKVQCHQCRRWYTCRHCHDEVEDHNLDRRRTQNMLCMVCGTPQAAGEHCIQCGTKAAWYYCDICKLWDDNSSKKIYHCMDCGICRRGAGVGKDYIHCKRCNVCISISHETSHKCLERATDCDCPICGEYLFNSSSAVVSMPCGHYLHKGCYNLYMETAYKCPMCKKSAVNMELQWQKLTQAIESQPMPEQFADTRAVIQCNDCSAKSSVKYHWLGNKCNGCDSYNTSELRILNGPESEQAANALLDADASANANLEARSPASVSSPSSQPLRSPRYYFQPDQPEETWLPGQLPSFSFQMPQFPGMPQMPQFPGIPQIPQFSGMPHLPPFPQMPQMPDPYELIERVRRSFLPFHNYLNPTGEISTENVPIIDLGEDRPEGRATDGTTVRQPSLPQYVLQRFNTSLTPLRNYLNPSFDNIPNLDLAEDRDPDALRRWGLDGRRFDRFLSGGEENDDDGSSSSDESIEEEEEDDDEGDADGDHNDISLPGHR
ncbi:hypothetical protein K504DRAFT_467313 [Pleomassaria siparia CBS 279.74]|uniref:Zf-CHY-domain-containing protein n=1 Tax=Pleomassaria siparia CBS 279.74 TaxID=1314801 RepID=A0A6G1K958_9PLEO|nr:hypothetical protein K504DRAFT_467313 [Pleomassaria siparia CBS 279.74]